VAATGCWILGFGEPGCSEHAALATGDAVKERDVGSPIKYAVVISLLGYVFVVASAVVIWFLFGLTSGSYPSFAFFALGLITFRLTEIHGGFFAIPPLLATVGIVFLNGTPLDRRIGAGIGLASYYILVAFTYVIAGAGEFPLETVTPWIVWVFVLGLGSSAIVDRLDDWYSERQL
jgi:hypothetical protein